MIHILRPIRCLISPPPPPPSQNGGVHGGVADNRPYRGSKGSLFEGGIRARGFVHGPVLTKTGYEHDG
jgi:arylsulfatase A-like enzyme